MDSITESFQIGVKLGVETLKEVIQNVRATPPLPATRLDGQVCVVTGATSGIGYETAREFASRGAKVILGCRDKLRGDKTAKELSKEGGEVVCMKLDLASFKSVEDFCRKILQEESSIDILVNNAGVFCVDKEMTEDGYERQMQVNHLSHFLLTRLLLERIRSQDGGRIINISSVAHWMSIGVPRDVNWEMVRYNGFLAYCNSKLANVLFSNELEKRLRGTGVSVYSVHPGAVSTNLGRDVEKYVPEQIQSALSAAFNWVAKTPNEGAKTTLFCALAPNLPSGYYDEMREGWMSPLGNNKDLTTNLWQLSEDLTGVRFNQTY